MISNIVNLSQYLEPQNQGSTVPIAPASPPQPQPQATPPSPQMSMAPSNTNSSPAIQTGGGFDLGGIMSSIWGGVTSAVSGAIGAVGNTAQNILEKSIPMQIAAKVDAGTPFGQATSEAFNAPIVNRNVTEEANLVASGKTPLEAKQLVMEHQAQNLVLGFMNPASGATNDFEAMVSAIAKEKNPGVIEKIIGPMVSDYAKSPEDITALANKLADIKDPLAVQRALTNFVIPPSISDIPKSPSVLPATFKAPSDPALIKPDVPTPKDVGSPLVTAGQKLDPQIMSSLSDKYGTTIANKISSLGSDFAQGALVPGGEKMVQQQLALNDGATAASKLMDALDQSQKLVTKQEAMRSVELGKRFTGAEATAQNIGGEAGAKAALSKLGGELPKLDLGTKFVQEDADAMFNSITNTYTLTGGGKATARKALLDLMSGTLPQQSGIDALRAVFGNDFAQSIMEKPTVWQEIGAGVREAINLPRALMSSFDLSAAFRQGALLIATKPKVGFGNMIDMVKYFGSDEIYQAAMKDVQANPLFNLANDAGLSFTGTYGEAPGLAQREEYFMSNLAEKIPLIGRMVTASERAYVGFLNKTRMDVYEQVANEYILGGTLPGENPEVFKDLANFVNAASGRGTFWGNATLNQAAPLLNTVFFAPRFVASRVEAAATMFDPTVSPLVRKTAAATFVKFVGTGLAILGMAKAGGAEVEDNPLSSDFGKIKVGNIRYDIWAGNQPFVRYTAQLIMGQRKTLSTGDIVAANRGATALTFMRSKLAPVPGIIADIMAGADMVGQPITFSSEAYQKLIPIYIQDLVDAGQQYGATGVAAIAIPGILGIGTQSFSSLPKNPTIGDYIQGSMAKTPSLKNYIGQ